MQTRNGEVTLPLVGVPQALRERFGVECTYWRVYRLIIDGHVTGTRRGRFLHVAESDLPRIAEALSMKAA